MYHSLRLQYTTVGLGRRRLRITALRRGIPFKKKNSSKYQARISMLIGFFLCS